MIKFLQRQRLVKKGLASPKQRRRHSPNEIIEELDRCLWGKGLVFIGFLAGLTALIFTGNPQSQRLEIFLTGLLITLTAFGHLWINHPRTFARNSRLLLVFGVCLIHLTFLKGIFAMARSGAISREFAPLILPIAFAPLVLSVLLGRNLGIFAATFVSLWGSVVLSGVTPANFPVIFIVMSLISGFIAVFLTLEVRKRSRLIRAGVFVGLATWLMALMFGVIGPIGWGFFAVNWPLIALESLATVASGVFTAILVSGILPILESGFQITTDISWLEAADLNHPLLKRMTIEAPGTYHHSLVVANLAEAAAESIGANPTRARVCAYFHDIGKLVKPDYFSENTDPEHNPHNDLAPTMSALIIIAHVKEGVDLALKHKLKKQIVDAIAQHHGTSLVWYFYRRALQQQEDARQGGKIMNIREEDIPDVSEASFRYPGPLPQSKEVAIIALADAVESASRSLEKVTPQRVDQMIHDLIEQRIDDGQLDECGLSLRELKTVAASLKSTLLSMLHSRVAYPKANAPAEARPEQRSGPSPLPPVSAA